MLGCFAVIAMVVLDQGPARIGLGLLAFLLILWANDRQTIAVAKV